MIRSIFFATGMFVAMCGGSFLMVDEMVLVFKAEEEVVPEPEPEKEIRGMFMSRNENDQQVFNPPEWVAFCLMSVGTVTMLYSIVLPKRRAAPPA